MAKKSAVNRNQRVKKLVKQYAAKRQLLKDIASNESLPLEERFDARLKLAQLPRNSSATRNHRPPARLLPQAQDEPDCAARPRVGRPDPRSRQVELVGEGPWSTIPSAI